MDPAGSGALVSGGASGLGLATVEALAAKGAGARWARFVSIIKGQGIMGKAKAIVDICHAANDAFRLQLKQALQWKDQVRVAHGIAAVVVLVRDTEFCVAGSTRNDAKRGVCLQIERRIGAEMHACRAHNSDRCLRKRARK